RGGRGLAPLEPLARRQLAKRAHQLARALLGRQAPELVREHLDADDAAIPDRLDRGCELRELESAAARQQAPEAPLEYGVRVGHGRAVVHVNEADAVAAERPQLRQRLAASEDVPRGDEQPAAVPADRLAELSRLGERPQMAEPDELECQPSTRASANYGTREPLAH